jgi:hypothetical protein
MRKEEEEGIRSPDPDRLNDPRHWEERAEEAVVMAEGMRDSEARATMLKVAELYRRLAEWATERGGAP